MSGSKGTGRGRNSKQKKRRSESPPIMSGDESSSDETPSLVPSRGARRERGNLKVHTTAVLNRFTAQLLTGPYAGFLKGGVVGGHAL